jgi:hypothetical protein
VQGGHPLSTVYSFVPIPGAQQHKRPRRRYEEIERMYKCGWNGCEKAYGTLNHLNAHVTMQSHGQKRTPEGMYMLSFPGTFRCRGGPCKPSALSKHWGWCWCCAILMVFPLRWIASKAEANTFNPGLYILAQPYYLSRIMLTRYQFRVQGNSQGVEGKEEGGGGPTQG